MRILLFQKAFSDCYTLRKKNQSKFSVIPVTLVSSVAEDVFLSPPKALSTVAAVSHTNERTIVSSDSCLNVIELNNITYLTALLDTDGLISFVQLSVFEKFFNLPVYS